MRVEGRSVSLCALSFTLQQLQGKLAQEMKLEKKGAKLAGQNERFYQERCGQLEAELQAVKVELAQAQTTARGGKRLSASGRKKVGTAKSKAHAAAGHHEGHFRVASVPPTQQHQLQQHAATYETDPPQSQRQVRQRPHTASGHPSQQQQQQQPNWDPHAQSNDDSSSFDVSDQALMNLG
jgi:hypothetical protein